VVRAMSDESSTEKASEGSSTTKRAPQSLLDAHIEALRLRSEIELLQLEAESKIADIRRELRADLVEKEERLDSLRARVDLLRVHERRRADDDWIDDDYNHRDPADYSYRYSRSRRTSARGSRRRPVARTARSSDSSDTSDRIFDEMSRLLRGVGEVLAEQAHTAADASSYVADSLQRRTGDRGTTTRDISGGISDAIDRIIDMPGEVVDRVRDVYGD